jgi:hypothetical protein
MENSNGNSFNYLSNIKIKTFHAIIAIEFIGHY